MTNPDIKRKEQCLCCYWWNRSKKVDQDYNMCHKEPIEVATRYTHFCSYFKHFGELA